MKRFDCSGHRVICNELGEYILFSEHEKIVSELMTSKKEVNSPIKSGWRGNLNGAVEKTKHTSIQVSEVTISLDNETAWALCNLLSDNNLTNDKLDKNQISGLSNLGAALGVIFDHPSANNGNRNILKL